MKFKIYSKNGEYVVKQRHWSGWKWWKKFIPCEYDYYEYIYFTSIDAAEKAIKEKVRQIEDNVEIFIKELTIRDV